VPIVPVGLWNTPRPGGGWTVWLRFGHPTHAPQLAAVEAAVRSLSRAPSEETLRFSGNDSSVRVGRAGAMTHRPDLQ